jgi:hypothetical protein
MALVMPMGDFIGHGLDAVIPLEAPHHIHAILDEPGRAGEEGRRQTIVAEGGAQPRQRQRTLLVLGDVLLAGPEHLDRATHLFGDLRRLTGHARAAGAIAAKAAPQIHGVGEDGLGIDPQLIGHQQDRR